MAALPPFFRALVHVTNDPLPLSPLLYIPPPPPLCSTSSPPASVVSAYILDSGRAVPSVCVAIGDGVYVYRGLRPYFRAQLPNLPISQAESEAWSAVSAATLRGASPDTQRLWERLTQLRVSGTPLAPRSRALLAAKSAAERRTLAPQLAAIGTPTTTGRADVAACMTTLHKTVDEPGAESCLVVGTETGQCVHILSPATFKVLTSFNLPSPAHVLDAAGAYDVDWRIVAACRDNAVYTLRPGGRFTRTVSLPAACVGLARVGKVIVVATADSALCAYTSRGRRLWSVAQPHAISALTAVRYSRRAFTGVVIGLTNGDVRLYNAKRAMGASASLPSAVSAFVCGRLGKTEGALCCATVTGGLHVLALRRGTELKFKEERPGPPPEQSIRVAVPPQTRLRVEQAARERQGSVAMHRAFQRDLYLLRLRATRAYARTLRTGLAPVTATTQSSLSLGAEVHGIGPRFRLVVTLRNTAVKDALRNCIVSFVWPCDTYAVEPAMIEAPILVPGAAYELATWVTCREPERLAARNIRVLVARPPQAMPLLTGVVEMPVAEPLITVR